ncbi:uncharacterized protein C8R40DRAFT_1176090 [Lentinula edodes]|uniref:uncharacterized protein n=1 Tax=Lentinula edodes TaxID=5353 RepID=UPI001E8E030B|nr:uncharacterized protein C8R40DRAFT_1176090 [Lentinula edodes]KAH7869980.1 hypothetical protein C8R40DRAFT_1176090 [Lentinula edodes]
MTSLTTIHSPLRFLGLHSGKAMCWMSGIAHAQALFSTEGTENEGWVHRKPISLLVQMDIVVCMSREFSRNVETLPPPRRMAVNEVVYYVMSGVGDALTARGDPIVSSPLRTAEPIARPITLPLITPTDEEPAAGSVVSRSPRYISPIDLPFHVPRNTNLPPSPPPSPDVAGAISSFSAPRRMRWSLTHLGYIDILVPLRRRNLLSGTPAFWLFLEFTSDRTSSICRPSLQQVHGTIG